MEIRQSPARTLPSFVTTMGVDFDQSCAIILEGFIESEDQPGDLVDVLAGNLEFVSKVESVVDFESPDDINIHKGDPISAEPTRCPSRLPWRT